ncbi:MAG TPA: adenylate/guanylate cyclase domain-containing protein [Acidimicrobiia bacterium]|nr:adenylate/guanylate cyclase domain-containing protein [Acidimicrobiia bacterium]
MNRRLRAFLRRQGASHAEIAQAEREGRLALLAFDRTLMPGRQRYRLDDVRRKAGVERENAQRLWRALGFPDPPADARRFTDEDIEALKALRDVFNAEGIVGHHALTAGRSVEGLVQQVRVVGAALARIAEVQSDAMLEAFKEARDSGMSDEQVAELVPDSLNWERISQLLDYAMRIQLRAALWRKYAGSQPGEVGEQLLTVGFVDLVGYTALSQELEEEELADLVSRFEGIAYDTVAEHGARVVKMIGDEVMFVSEDTAAAARIALQLSERSTVDEVLPEARAGLACGPVVSHEGDYYGPVVNLASRMVELARPGSVLTSEEVHDALGADASFGFQRLRSRKIRDIGRVEVWLLESVHEQDQEAAL